MNWTAARTARIRIAPNVLNMAMRAPAMTANAASLDLLSRGRIEPGPGAGVFWDAITTMGMPRRAQRQAIDALSEAIDIIHATWGNGDAQGRDAWLPRRYHHLDGMLPGPPAAHPMPIWLGAHKPRMLRLTGQKADAWTAALGRIQDRDQRQAASALIDQPISVRNDMDHRSKQMSKMTKSDLGSVAAADGQAGPHGKRERLIAAAAQMIYRHGVEKTTLADIAAAAEVPLGNVYYYFKTKNDLVQAVVKTHLAEASTTLTAVEAAREAPRERLKALFSALAGQSEMIPWYGCPHGSLCQELAKRADGLGPAADLMIITVDWAARQFDAIGRRDAYDLAVQVIARYQGTALLTSTLHDPDLMTRETLRVAQWIDTLLPSECATSDLNTNRIPAMCGASQFRVERHG